MKIYVHWVIYASFIFLSFLFPSLIIKNAEKLTSSNRHPVPIARGKRKTYVWFPYDFRSSCTDRGSFNFRSTLCLFLTFRYCVVTTHIPFNTV